VDWVVVCIAFYLALFLQGYVVGTRREIADTLTSYGFLSFLIFSPVVMYIFQSNRLYKLDLHLTVRSQMKSVLKCLLYATIALAVFLMFAADTTLLAEGRYLVLGFFGIAAVLLIVERVFVMRSLFLFLVEHNLSSRLVLVIGTCMNAKKLVTSLGRRNRFGLRLVGFVDDEHPVGTEIDGGIKVLGRVDDIERVVTKTRTDEILVCLEGIPEERYLSILERCGRTRARVMVGSEQFSVITRHVYNENYGGLPVFGMMNSSPYFGAPVIKRIGDFVLSLIGLMVLSPVFLLIAIAIKIDSPGPVLFRQVRIGKNGKPFEFLKFRSMVVGSDNDHARVKKLEAFIKRDKTDEEGTTKIVDRSKITRVGQFIRRTSLDELPQLVNVLKGDMSLVGPRPCLPYEWESYDEWHKKRLSITPGCTGVWQVFGRSKVGFRDSVIIDLFYAQNMSFRLDLWLVLKTIPVMLFGSGGK
jgi:undecaprenyl-phosphate galactose phosphotransferase